MQLQRNVMMAVRAWFLGSRRTAGNSRNASPVAQRAHRAGASGGEVAGYATLVRL